MDQELASVRLTHKYNELRANGLQDFKIWMGPDIGPNPMKRGQQTAPEVTLEDMCQEVLDIFAIYESGLFEDITHKLG